MPFRVTLSVGLAKLAGNLQMLTFYAVRYYRLHVILIIWSFFFKEGLLLSTVYE